MAIDDLTLFTGNANPALAQEIAAQLGIGIGRATVSTFSDGEVNVEIMENVRGADVFVIQTSAPPVNEGIIELLIFLDKMHAAGFIKDYGRAMLRTARTVTEALSLLQA